MVTVKASEVYTDPAVAQLADAAARGDKQRIAELVRQGVDVNALGDKETNLLEWALFHRSIDGMQALLEAGADPSITSRGGRTVMHLAAGADDPKLMRALLATGVSPDLRNSKTGETPLFEAIMHDREPQFRILLGAGADLDAENFDGDRPLHHAALINSWQWVLVLLEAGADPRATNRHGFTFQGYLTGGDTKEFHERKVKINAWLVEHGVEVEPEPEEE